MAIILDADVIIRGEKGTFDLKGWLASRPNELFEVAAITVAELWHGVETGYRRAQEPGASNTCRQCWPRCPSFPTPSRPPMNMPGFGPNWKRLER